MKNQNLSVVLAGAKASWTITDHHDGTASGTNGTDTVSLVLRAWVPTADYREELRNLTESAKGRLNALLKGSVGGTANITEAQDPHLAQTATQTSGSGNVSE